MDYFGRMEVLLNLRIDLSLNDLFSLLFGFLGVLVGLLRDLRFGGVRRRVLGSFKC